MTQSNIKRATQNHVKQLKYNIVERLSKFTPQYKKDFVAGIANRCNCSPSSVQRVMYRKTDSQEVDSYIILKAIAENFKVPVESLENFIPA